MKDTRKTERYREKTVEDLLVEGIENLGGYIRKTKSPGHNGFVDRIVVFRGWVWFVELKSPIGYRSKLQKLEHKALAEAQANVIILRTKGEVICWLKSLEPLPNCPAPPINEPI